MKTRNITVEQFLSAIEMFPGAVKWAFKMGGCFHFYLFVKEIFPDAEPYYSELANHVVVKVGDTAFDCGGKFIPWHPSYKKMTDNECIEAHNWVNRLPSEGYLTNLTIGHIFSGPTPNEENDPFGVREHFRCES